MNVTFCGHAQITEREALQNWLQTVTQSLIEQGATTFYLGGYGAFDSLAAAVLREQKKRYPQVELVLVLAYLIIMGCPIRYLIKQVHRIVLKKTFFML